ncbi:hypothetical protein GCM10008905_20270 [Clostridium malenominatum]|uniref:Uncharacterized protein n=1 Tax=Clostridium malenominatum TaxID=1539 RepID=A0ABP3UAB0_9CLOT
MLIQYEYEVLSFAALISTSKVDGNLSFLLSKLNDELEEDAELYIKKLKINGFIDDKPERITIITNNWIEFFVNLLQNEFDKNNMNVRCKLDKVSKAIDFNINGSNKKFDLILNEKYKVNNINKDCIYMCKVYEYSDEIYWLDLLNDINLLSLFYNYLINEVSHINKSIYMKIDNLEGLATSHVSEIFNNSIKKYFFGKEYTIVELEDSEIKYIKKLMADDNISFYAVKKNKIVIYIIKKKDAITFLELKDSEVYFSNFVNREISELKEKLDKKISQYRNLVMYKENNVLDTNIKLTTQLATYTAPITMIISILGLLNINISKLIQYKWILITAIIVLAMIQAGIFIFIYVPGYKINRFKWDIH